LSFVHLSRILTDPLAFEASLNMKIEIFALLVTALFVSSSAAEDRIYRCGNEYTNTVSEAQAKNCKLISGSNVTVVQAHKSPPAATRLATSGQRVDSDDQRGKDSDSRRILEDELKKAEARQVELLREYNNGEPDKLGPETRNHQKYLDRVAELKANIARNESDIAGIKREIGRIPGNAAPKQY
jgi:hypothetical protein